VKYCSAVVAPPLFHRARAKGDRSEGAKQRRGERAKGRLGEGEKREYRREQVEYFINLINN